MKKNKIIITGGAGFVGTNLINLLIKKTNFKITYPEDLNYFKLFLKQTFQEKDK